MLPVYILCHADCDSVGYLCEYLDKHNISYKKMNILKSDISSIDLAMVSGLVFMGGPYSLQQGYDWVDKEIQLINQAIDNKVPLMGVCLGAQLISKALGAEVYSAQHMETGWHPVVFNDCFLHDNLLMFDQPFDVFEWHEDAFTIPDGAQPVFKGENFENQGYIMGDILAMQFHLEMTGEMIKEWLKRYQDCLPESSQYVQSPEDILKNLDQRLIKLNRVADTLYGWWLNKLKKD